MTSGGLAEPVQKAASLPATPVHLRVTPAKVRRNRVASLVLSAGTVLLFLLLGAFYVATPSGWVGLLCVALVVGVGAFLFFTRKYRRRTRILRAEFPDTWRRILASRVVFYASLDPSQRQRFEAEISIFLAEKRITGVKTELDDATRLLVAASAVIPIFGFPEWEYDNLAEVLIYPASFNADYEFAESAQRNILGLVGSGGALNRIMILSKPDLERGFARPTDRQNVGIHEFAHLVDGADGSIDGMPLAACPDCAKPWVEIMRQEMARLEKGKSILNRYGLTNEAEFFAVASEAFFETPAKLASQHPDLYRMLERIFQQDARSQLEATARAMFTPYPRKIGRNAKCPCGNGKKYKRCCLHGR